MLLLTHIVIALSSVIFTTLLYFSPSKAKLNFSYVLIGLTFISGTILTISKPAHMIQACTVGLLYLGAVSITTIAARNKMSKVTEKINLKDI